MKYVVTVNGKQYDVEVEKVGGGYQPVSRNVASAPIPRVATPQPVAPAPAAAPAAAPVSEAVVSPKPAASVSESDTKIECPMPGAILDVKVNVGDVVKNGQVLLILEAMKMENEIVSPVAGTISSVMVKKGDTVDSGRILINIK